MHLRDATPDDADLLVDLLLEAFNWTGEARFTRNDVLRDPHTVRYVGGWGRPGDLGLVAVEDGQALGGVWARALPADEPGYGYVADDVPELGLAVLPGARGRGVGSALLAGLLDRARDAGWRAVSLSVEDGNAAARALYERHGFVVVGRNGGSDTMLRTLQPARNARADAGVAPA
ncbi:GNAT family N-acetyltransferase [Cellulomonas telluris]|uniref:GNAT family N-acetyltransferase n=1 Tax=Cellulomonas telluris TaxID=2306636 RepID=UPI0010A8BECB|nr:GNAT family N-acetyltransferase [Cellulomonas telluris]